MSLLPSTQRALLHRLASVQHDDRQPSLVAGLVRDGELVWSAGRGDAGGTAGEVGGDGADPVDVQYRIGSITKTMTAVLVLQCRDDGLLGLDEAVASYLPEAPWPEVTVRHLLAHAGGVPAELPGPWWERHDGGDLDDLLHRIGPDPLVLAAGSRFHYSNVGFALLGAVVERLRGGRFPDLLRDRVLGPLSMHRTTYAPDGLHAQGRSVREATGRLDDEPHSDTAAMAPAGQVWSTVGDLARWGAFWLRPDPDVLAPATAREMTVPTVGTHEAGWGLGLSLHDGPRGRRFGHGGSMPGFVAGFVVDPHERTAGISLANATSGGGRALAWSLLDLLHRHEPSLPPVWRPEPEVPGADELAGTWWWGNTSTSLVVRDGTLRLDTGNPMRDARFAPAGTDCWRGLSGYSTGETLRVVRAGDGSVDHLDLHTYVLRRHPHA